MCYKCEIKKGILSIFGAEVQQVEVGVISAAAKEELTQLEAAQERLDAELEAATEAAAKELEARFKEKEEGLAKLKNKAWKDALASAGIDVMKQAADYGINKETGVVTLTKIVEAAEAQAETAPGVH